MAGNESNNNSSAFQWLTRKTLPNWGVFASAIGAAILALLPSLADYFIGGNDRFSNRVDSRVTELRQSAADMQVLAADYVTNILNGDPDPEEERVQLEQFIILQSENIGLSSDVYDEETAKAAEAYQDRLSNLLNALQSEQSIIELGNFWEAMAQVLEARNLFIERLTGLI